MELTSNGMTQEDYDRIDEVDRIMDDLRVLIPKLKKHIRQLSRAVDYAETDIERLYRLTDGEITDIDDADKCSEIAVDFFIKCATGLNASVWLIVNSGARKSLIDLLPDYKDAFMESIQVKVESGVLYVKTPLISYNCNQFVFTQGRAVRINYSCYFRDEIARQMHKMEEELPDFGPRNLNLLAVYDGSNMQIPDTLNLDIKTTVDAITDYMPGKDGWNSCSFSLASIIDKDIEPGLYFTVTDGFAVAPDPQKNLANLKRIFPQNRPQNLSDN